MKSLFFPSLNGWERSKPLAWPELIALVKKKSYTRKHFLQGSQATLSSTPYTLVTQEARKACIGARK